MTGGPLPIMADDELRKVQYEMKLPIKKKYEMKLLREEQQREQVELERLRETVGLLLKEQKRAQEEQEELGLELKKLQPEVELLREERQREQEERQRERKEEKRRRREDQKRPSSYYGRSIVELTREEELKKVQHELELLRKERQIEHEELKLLLEERRREWEEEEERRRKEEQILRDAHQKEIDELKSFMMQLSYANICVEVEMDSIFTDSMEMASANENCATVLAKSQEMQVHIPAEVGAKKNFNLRWSYFERSDRGSGRSDRVSGRRRRDDIGRIIKSIAELAREEELEKVQHELELLREERKREQEERRREREEQEIETTQGGSEKEKICAYDRKFEKYSKLIDDQVKMIEQLELKRKEEVRNAFKNYASPLYEEVHVLKNQVDVCQRQENQVETLKDLCQRQEEKIYDQVKMIEQLELKRKEEARNAFENYASPLYEEVCVLKNQVEILKDVCQRQENQVETLKDLCQRQEEKICAYDRKFEKYSKSIDDQAKMIEQLEVAVLCAYMQVEGRVGAYLTCRT
ncbi:hypothetical protein C3L33_05487, partial [Rhododendron williamsianum]